MRIRARLAARLTPSDIETLNGVLNGDRKGLIHTGPVRLVQPTAVIGTNPTPTP